MDREQGHNAGHLLGLQDLLKVGCSSAGEPRGGPGLPSSLSGKGKLEPSPGTLKVVCRMGGRGPRALTAGIPSS